MGRTCIQELQGHKNGKYKNYQNQSSVKNSSIETISPAWFLITLIGRSRLMDGKAHNRGKQLK